MKKIVSIICVLASLGFVNNDVIKNSVSASIEDGSTVTIMGTTNVNDFSCILNFYQVNSNIKTEYTKTNNRITFNNASIILENSCFDCGNKMMNNDFVKMLNSSEYPCIAIQLKEVVINPKNPQEIYALAAFSMAGRTASYSIPMTLQNGEIFKVNGCLSLKLSDFDIDPPKKALGLIVVSEEVDIHFDLKFRTH